MTCGRYLHCIPAATSAPKARVFLYSISQKLSYCSPCIGRCIPMLIILCEKIQNNANATMHLLNPLQAPKLFCSFHSVTPLPHTTSPKHSVKRNQIDVRSLLPFRCIPFQAFVPHDPFTPLHLHSISHLSPESKSAAHPCPLLHIPSILQNQPF